MVLGKKMVVLLGGVLVFSFLFVPGVCLGMSDEDILKELRALKNRVDRLEVALSKKDKKIKELEGRLSGNENSDTPTAGNNWTDRIELSGLVEVEFANEQHDIKVPADNFRSNTTQSHDVVLATVELGVDAEINKYTHAHVKLLYEEDDTDPINIDEATMTIGGTPDTYGLYFMGGRYYPYFGALNSYFVSNPLTLEIFEINESALEAGYTGDWFTGGIGLFHGNIQEKFKTESRINGLYANASFHNPEDTLGGLSLLFGLSYLSNVADSDTLEGEVQDINGDGLSNDLNDYVSGIAAYFVADYGFFSLGAEYISATDNFLAGEMGYALDRNGVAKKTQPAAWNTEIAFRPLETIQIALKYEGSDDMFGLYPEHQFGGAVSWEIFKATVLSAEVLHGVYQNNNRNADGVEEDERDLVTLQLAVGF